MSQFTILLVACICVALTMSQSQPQQLPQPEEDENGSSVSKSAPGVFETIKEMENYFDKMYIIEHLRSNMHTKLDVLNQVKAQLVSSESRALSEQEKVKFGSLVDSMTKTYKLLDIILVDFLPTEQDLLEIVEENTHLFGKRI